MRPQDLRSPAWSRFAVPAFLFLAVLAIAAWWWWQRGAEGQVAIAPPPSAPSAPAPLPRGFTIGEVVQLPGPAVCREAPAPKPHHAKRPRAGKRGGAWGPGDYRGVQQNQWR